ncbi:MAG: trypsin-like peptidase domain-containing protein [Planctomycetota bacterium]
MNRTQRPFRHLRLSLVLTLIVSAISADLQAQNELERVRTLQGLEPEPEELDLRRTPVVRAVERAADSVVSIYVERRDANPRRPEARVEGQGSGVVVEAEGLVITNWHVIAQVESSRGDYALEVRLKDERRFPALLLSSSPEHDLALLQMQLPDDEKVTPIDAGRSESLMVGETVIAIGNPQGQANTVTVGVLSATEREITVRTPEGRVRRFPGLLQTDAAINRGNSGGALLDITGKLIGINNAMAVGVENIGFAIPIDTVERVFQEELSAYDGLSNVWIGARIGDDGGRPVVQSVFAGGPADRVGLRQGDLVLQVSERPVGSALDVGRILFDATDGTSVPLLVQRGDREIDLNVRAIGPAHRRVVLGLGLEFEAVSPEEDVDLLTRASAEFYGARVRGPAIPVVFRIQHVYEQGPAAAIGFEPGDVLIGTRQRRGFGRVQNVPFRSVEGLSDVVRFSSGSEMYVIVLRDGEALEGTIEVRQPI